MLYESRNKTGAELEDIKTNTDCQTAWDLTLNRTRKGADTCGRALSFPKGTLRRARDGESLAADIYAASKPLTLLVN